MPKFTRRTGDAFGTGDATGAVGGTASAGPVTDTGAVRSHRTAALLMAGYVLVVGLIVFWPTAAVASGSVNGIWSVLNRIGLGWISPTVVEFVTNTIMFMPLGYLGHTFKPHWGWRQWLLAGLAGTLTIELTQLLFLADRSAQIQDVVSNTLGAVAGYGVVVVRGRRARGRVSASADRRP